MGLKTTACPWVAVSPSGKETINDGWNMIVSTITVFNVVYCLSA